MGKFDGRLMRMLIDDLALTGKEAIANAYGRRGFKNQLYNLHDSYASAVYVDGRLDKSTIYYVGDEMSKRTRSAPKKQRSNWIWKKGRSMPDFRGERRLPGDEIMISGREEAMDFLQHYSDAPRGTICLVVVAAMFYASILESGRGLRNSYAVIRGALPLLQDTALRYRGSVTRINKYRDMSKPPTIKNQTWKK